VLSSFHVFVFPEVRGSGIRLREALRTDKTRLRKGTTDIALYKE